MASTARNDWQSQPRDAETGRWKERGGEYLPRNQEIKIRINYREAQKIRAAAASAGKTVTRWVIDACIDRITHAPAPQSPMLEHQMRLAKQLHQNRRRR